MPDLLDKNWAKSSDSGISAPIEQSAPVDEQNKIPYAAWRRRRGFFCAETL
jgi:hypothetical protein